LRTAKRNAAGHGGMIVKENETTKMPAPTLYKRECERFTVFGMTVRLRSTGRLHSNIAEEESANPVLDLSRGGLKFLSQTGIPQGTKLVLRLFSPEDREIMAIKGSTVWMAINPGQSYKYQIGVQFAPFGREKGDNPLDCLEILTEMEKRHLTGK